MVLSSGFGIITDLLLAEFSLAKNIAHKAGSFLKTSSGPVQGIILVQVLVGYIII